MIEDDNSKIDEGRLTGEAPSEGKDLITGSAYAKDFAPIVWPRPGAVCIETITIIIVTVVLSIIIYFLDFGIRVGLEELMKL